MKTNMLELNEKLFSLLGDVVFIKKWWNSPNFHFGLMTPYEVYKKDRKAVEKYINNQFDMQI